MKFFILTYKIKSKNKYKIFKIKKKFIENVMFKPHKFNIFKACKLLNQHDCLRVEC